MNLQGMLPSGKDGLLIPSRQQVWRALASLPADGRAAYRLFNDAKAKQLFEQAKAPETADEVAALRKIFDQHFVTSVGDQAADRLGDAYFEAGDFLAADAAWKAILDFYPDTALPKPKLRAKRCAALARASRWDDFERVATELTSGGAGETVQVAGRSVPAAQYVQSLRSLRSAAATTQPSTTRPSLTQPASTQPTTQPAAPLVEPTGPLALPGTETPLWQASFVDKSLMERADQQLQNMGWEGMASAFSTHVPPTAADSRRVYVNWFGIAFALDARTGKLLWRSRKMSEMEGAVQNFVMSGVDLSRYQIALAGDRLLVTGIPFDQLNRGSQSNYKLVCHNAETGAVVWSNKTGQASNINIAGQPIVVGDIIYVPGQRGGQQEIQLLAMALADGKLLWSVTLGTPQSGMDYRGNSQAPAPTLAYNAGTVYVLTNNGALVAVDTASRRVEWALAYDPPPVLTGYPMFGPAYMQRQSVKTPGAVLVRGSTLYLKEADGYALYAVDLAGPAVKWKRPLDTHATVADIDDKCVYTMGEELSAIDLNTRQMKWSTKLPIATGSLRLVRGGSSFFVFSTRGVFEVDAATGDPSPKVFRVADKDSLGGRLWRAPDRLITVSNLAVTAYPLGGEAARSGG